MSENGDKLDVITFSGNGEPTLHPDFAEIITDTLRIRDRYFPDVKVTVLSNSTCLTKPKVVAALKKLDRNILKLDSAVPATMYSINAPLNKNFTVEGVIADLKQFAGNCIIQTMMLRGEHNGKTIDNTTDAEVNALIEAYKEIQPKSVMLYSIDRKTPEEKLEKVGKEELSAIADKIRQAGIEVETF